MKEDIFRPAGGSRYSTESRLLYADTAVQRKFEPVSKRMIEDKLHAHPVFQKNCARKGAVQGKEKDNFKEKQK
eukprot:153901-Heterocapsa_arctica.AAC.1